LVRRTQRCARQRDQEVFSNHLFNQNGLAGFRRTRQRNDLAWCIQSVPEDALS
jgi:hypothetical protein